MENLTEYFNIFAAVVAVASLVANVTPTKKDDAIVSKISGLVNLLALNFFRRK